MALTKTSDKKREANARNAQRSTGPKTAEGKERSSRNAVKHGLSSTHLHNPMRYESADHFQTTVEGLMRSWNPANDQEEQLVKGIAIAWMRIERSERWESAALSGVIRTRERALAKTFNLKDENDDAPELDEDLGCCIAMIDKRGEKMWDQVQRHSTKAWRDWERAIDTLRKLQNNRKREEQSQVRQLKTLTATAGETVSLAPVVHQPAGQQVAAAKPTTPSVSTDLASFCTRGQNELSVSEPPAQTVNPLGNGGEIPIAA